MILKRGPVLALLSVLLGFSSSTFGIAVLEPEDDLTSEFIHGDVVSSVACPTTTQNCQLIYIDEVWTSAVSEKIKASLLNHTVVNMSFAFQKPTFSDSQHTYESQDKPQELTPEELLANYFTRLKSLREIISSHPDHLFIAAAGNGYSIGGLITDGVPLVRRNSMYPASFTEHENLVKVTSINATHTDLEKLEDYKIDYYANYSIETVDIAAPVETLQNDIRGTSFAAPLVARLSERAFALGLTIHQIKEMLFKSSYVQNLDAAIAMTEEFNKDAKNSTIAKILKEGNRKKRDALIEAAPSIMLVKSGGPLVEAFFNECLEIHSQTSKSIEDSCLSAHRKLLGLTTEREAKLRHFWKLRGL